MKLKNKYKVEKEFEDLFEFENEEDEIQHEAKILMFQFLDQLERTFKGDEKLKRKKLAEMLGLSPSFISQLYAGDKIISLPLIVKIQKAFKIQFQVSAKQTLEHEEVVKSKEVFQGQYLVDLGIVSPTSDTLMPANYHEIMLDYTLLSEGELEYNTIESKKFAQVKNEFQMSDAAA